MFEVLIIFGILITFYLLLKNFGSKVIKALEVVDTKNTKFQAKLCSLFHNVSVDDMSKQDTKTLKELRETAQVRFTNNMIKEGIAPAQILEFNLQQEALVVRIDQVLSYRRRQK
jgi:hypothetical protein